LGTHLIFEAGEDKPTMPQRGAWSGSRDSGNILETVQDRDIITMED